MQAKKGWLKHKTNVSIEGARAHWNVSSTETNESELCRKIRRKSLKMKQKETLTYLKCTCDCALNNLFGIRAFSQLRPRAKQPAVAAALTT